MRKDKPDRTEYLTVEDVESLPNGYSTVLAVRDQTHRRVQTGRIDKNGYVRTLDGDYVPRYWSVKADDS